MSPTTGASRHIVVVGAGQAGVQVAESLRGLGFDGEITLAGVEPHGPYHRPPLSKEWLLGRVEAAQLTLRTPQALDRKGIRLLTGTGVDSVDMRRRRAELDDGTALHFDGLALATGARPRRLPIPGADADGVAVLRSRDDATYVSGALERCAREGLPLVVVGGGYVGLEVAAAARDRGIPVTVLARSRLLGRVLARPLSDWFAALHLRHGVEVVLGAVVEEVTTDGATASGVRLAGGRTLPAGLVLMGVGAEPDDALARAAGLDCDRGIVVDTCGRTGHPDVVAAGDCTVTRRPDGSLLRLESVQNAVEQGKAAAAALLGFERPFDAVPWFWSQQYDVKLQLAGLADGIDHWVTRGDPDSGSFSLYGFGPAEPGPEEPGPPEPVPAAGGNGAVRLLAVQSVNAPRDHLTARKLLRARVGPTPAQVADPGIDLAAGPGTPPTA